MSNKPTATDLDEARRMGGILRRVQARFRAMGWKRAAVDLKQAERSLREAVRREERREEEARQRRGLPPRPTKGGAA